MTKEHVVPKFLDGSITILDASCEECRVITSDFERRVARDYWGDARLVFGHRISDRKKPTGPAAQTTATVLNKKTGKIRLIKKPAGSLPLKIVFPHRLGPPRCISRLPFPKDTDPHDIAVAYRLPVGPIAYATKSNEAIKFRSLDKFSDFDRFILKVAYSSAFHFVDGFRYNSELADRIRGERDDFTAVLGARIPQLDVTKKTGYFLGFGHEPVIIEGRDFTFLVATIRFFCQVKNSPEYRVVVGVDGWSMPAYKF